MEEEPTDVDDGPEPEWAPPEDPPVKKDPRDLSENPIRHFYLFAKGHYQRSLGKNGVEPMLIDCLKIMERAYGIKECDPEDFFKLILSEVWHSIAGPTDFETMFLFLRTQLMNVDKQPEITLIGADEALCKMCMVIMGIRVTVGELILGSPDPDVLNVINGDPKKYRRKYER